MDFGTGPTSRLMLNSGGPEWVHVGEPARGEGPGQVCTEDLRTV